MTDTPPDDGDSPPAGIGGTPEGQASSDTTGDVTESTTGDAVAGQSLILLVETGSYDRFARLGDPTSFESQLARGKGELQITDVSPHNDDRARTVQGRVTEGRLQVASGYDMLFVDETHRYAESVHDLLRIPDLKSYPVPESALESLPLRARARLQDRGHLRLRAVYDRQQQAFRQVQLGWEAAGTASDPWDRLLTLVDEHDIGVTPAVDYLWVEEGPDRWTVDRLAAARDVEPKTVAGHVRTVIDRMYRDRDPAQSTSERGATDSGTATGGGGDVDTDAHDREEPSR